MDGTANPPPDDPAKPEHLLRRGKLGDPIKIDDSEYVIVTRVGDSIVLDVWRGPKAWAAHVERREIIRQSGQRTKAARRLRSDEGKSGGAGGRRG